MAASVLFDRYELESPAGRGGSAEVWRARDLETDDVVAVKRLHPVTFADPAARQRLEREFRVLRSLDEPHVVAVRDLRIGEREAILVLDFIDGEPLSDRLSRARSNGRPMAPDDAAAIVGDVAAALAAAHEAGLVHRDVTPANILIGRDGVARLTDFGIAQASDDATAVTATGTLVGTMRYLAPEQLRGEPATPASDLHGLAAVAYEMLAGRAAYEAHSPVALVEAQRAGPAPLTDVPPALDHVVRAALDPDPARRPPGVLAFAADLRRALDDDVTMPIVLPAEIAATTDGAPPHEPAAIPTVSPSAPRRPARASRIPAPAAAAAAVLIAVAIVAAAGGSRSQAPAAGGDSTASATPSRTARPTATPTPTPVQNDGGGHGDGGGKGHGHGHDKKGGGGD